MMKRLIVFALFISAVAVSYAQQPFDLDQSFRAMFDDWYVSSILPNEDGTVLLSGRMRYLESDPFVTMIRLHSDGTRDLSYNENSWGGG